MTYETKNKVWSPRLHLLNLLRENWIYSEYPKEWYTKIIDESWYYFSEELLEKDFDFANSTFWKTSNEFMKITGYSRPKINTYIETHWRVVFLSAWYYDLESFRTFLQNEHIKEWVEKRWRPTKK